MIFKLGKNEVCGFHDNGSDLTQLK